MGDWFSALINQPTHYFFGGDMRPFFERYTTVLAIAFLSMTAWMAHFYLSGQFLLYEDDYAVMGRTLDLDFASLLGILKALWHDCPMGRPLHFTFGRIFAYLGNQMAGLQGMYWIGFTVVCANILLFFALMKKLAPVAVAFFGAVCFCLFPADTTKPLLTHSFMIQPGLTFLLVALLLYAGKRPWLSYVVIFGSLITYEPTALPFLMAPLLKKPWDRKRRKILCLHIVSIFACLLLAGVVRLMLHESRVSELVSHYPWEAAFKALGSLALGPFTVIWCFVARMFDGALNVRPWGALAGGVFLFLGIPLAMALQQGSVLVENVNNRLARLSMKTRILELDFEIKSNPHHRGILRLAILGISMRFCAYLLSFSYWPPMVMEGRETCVHIAASIGGTMVFAAVAWTFMVIGKAYRGHWGAILALTAYLSLLLCFHTTVQDDFAKSARLQKNFWRQIISLCPDLEEDTIIFVEPEGLPATHYIRSNFWTDRLILELMFQFPLNWRNPPRLYILDYQIYESIRRGPDQTILWNRPVPPPQDIVPSVLERKKVILLQMQNGGLDRQYGDVALGPGLLLELKPMGRSVLSLLPKRPLYHYITTN